MAASNAQIKSFIAEFSALAIAECNRRIAAGEGFVLPSVCLAQSALETGWGTAGLMTRANAYFGIKAGGSWTGKVYRADTWEVADGVAYNTVANFRAYDSKAESVADYYRMITSLSRYSKGICYGADKSKWLTPKECVTALWAGGYATDDNYVTKVMNTLNGRSLYDYDKLITGVASDAPTWNTASSFNFKTSEMKTGKLVIADNGRSIAFQNDVGALTIDWATQSTIVAYTGKYEIQTDVAAWLESNYSSYEANIYIATLENDTAKILGPFKNGQSVQLSAGTKVGYYIMFTDHRANNVAVNIRPATLPDSIALNMESDAAGYSSISAPIAYFIKIK